jgi:hypothetical protein
MRCAELCTHQVNVLCCVVLCAALRWQAVGGQANAASIKTAAADGPVLSAPLTKFIKDGKGSHTKHFSLYPSAMIEWREDPKDAKAHRGMWCVGGVW